MSFFKNRDFSIDKYEKKEYNIEVDILRQKRKEE